MSKQSNQAIPLKVLMSAFESVGIKTNELLDATKALGMSIPGKYQPLHPTSTLPELLQTAIKLSGDPSLAIRLGQQIDITNYGTYGFAIMSSVDIRAAIVLFLRYGKLVDPGSTWKLIEDDGGLTLRMQQPLGTVEQQQLVTELLFSSMYKIGRFLTDAPTLGIEVQLNYPKPAHFASYEKHLPVPILFDQQYSQFTLSEQLLKHLVKTANPAGNVVFMQQCEEMLRDLNREENISAAIRRQLIQSAGALLNITQIAEHLHITERTLRRRLDAESTNFRTICDEVRNVLAQKYLTTTLLKVSEIADLLNYTEQANFRRAFVRWNGVTPTQFREQAS